MVADISFVESVEKLPINRSFKFRKLATDFGFFQQLQCRLEKIAVFVQSYLSLQVLVFK